MNNDITKSSIYYTLRETSYLKKEWINCAERLKCAKWFDDIHDLTCVRPSVSFRASASARRSRSRSHSQNDLNGGVINHLGILPTTGNPKTQSEQAHTRARSAGKQTDHRPARGSPAFLESLTHPPRLDRHFSLTRHKLGTPRVRLSIQLNGRCNPTKGFQSKNSDIIQ